jgi:hypothetical protein
MFIKIRRELKGPFEGVDKNVKSYESTSYGIKSLYYAARFKFEVIPAFGEDVILRILL